MGWALKIAVKSLHVLPSLSHVLLCTWEKLIFPACVEKHGIGLGTRLRIAHL